MRQTSFIDCMQNEYDDLPPTYDSLLKNVNSTTYCYPPSVGISYEIDSCIAGRVPYCYLNSCEQVNHFTKTARQHRMKLAQTPSTLKAIKNLFTSHQLRGQELRLLPAALVHDLVAPPYHLTQLAISHSRSRFERTKVEAAILEEIMDSLLLSLEAVFKIITRLGLETHDAVEQQVQNGQVYTFLALARLLEAYRSRFAPPGTIFLASHKRLPKEHCPHTARLHFEQVHQLKEVLMAVDMVQTQDLSASTVLERCICTVFPALKNPSIDLDNQSGFSRITQRLRLVQDEMPGLLLSYTKK